MADDLRALLGRLKATAEAAPAGPWKQGDSLHVWTKDEARVVARTTPRAIEHVATFDPPTILRLLAICEAAERFRQALRGSDDELEARNDMNAALSSLKDHAHDR
jgi:hypothetical protein